MGKQAETRTDKAVMTQNDDDADNRVIAGRNPDWLSSGSGWPAVMTLNDGNYDENVWMKV